MVVGKAVGSVVGENVGAVVGKIVGRGVSPPGKEIVCFKFWSVSRKILGLHTAVPLLVPNSRLQEIVNVVCLELVFRTRGTQRPVNNIVTCKSTPTTRDRLVFQTHVPVNDTRRCKRNISLLEMWIST